jgi:hypothetical protein
MKAGLPSFLPGLFPGKPRKQYGLNKKIDQRKGENKKMVSCQKSLSGFFIFKGKVLTCPACRKFYAI